jgi:hypothetical protein
MSLAPRRPVSPRWLLLAAALLALPGCQVWNAWLDALKWKDGKPPADKSAAPRLAMPQPNSPGNGPATLIPRVSVYRITVPLGAFTANDKIWSQLNEDAIDSRTAVLMAQNGLRAATGALARWPAIAALLDVPGATTAQTLYQTDGHASINVVTRPNITDQIVVSVDRDLQQQGRTFERCDNGFRMAMRGVRGKPELLVELEPVVTLGTVAVLREGNEMGVTRTGFTSEESFADLHMATTLTADTFLVVSATDPKTSPYSVGTLWLSEQERAPATETVLVFVPAPASPPPAPATPAAAKSK